MAARRDAFLLTLLLLLFGGVIARLAVLQVVHGDAYARARERQTAASIVLSAARGDIRAGGVLLAGTRRIPSVFADPARVPDPQVAADALAPVLGIDAPRLMELLHQPNRFVWLRRHVTDAAAARVRELAIEGVGLRDEFLRFYPQDTARQLVGITDTDGRGLEGIELAMDSLLRGRDVRIPIEVDARRRGVGYPDRLPDPPCGRTVVLTIDPTVQRALEAAFAAGAERTGAAAVWGVAIEPQTGAIRGLAVWPPLDRADPDTRRNLALTDPFEPGSTMKPFIILRSLDRGVVGLDTRIDCGGGSSRVGPRIVRDHHALGILSVRDVIVRSSNVGAAQIGWRLGAAEQQRLLRDLGFGERSGLGLPGESPGRVTSARSWTTFSTATVPFGYEVSVTAIQLASAYAAIAADGVRMRPYVVQAILDPEGDVEWEAEPQAAAVIASAENARAMRRVLYEVVERGTAREARVDGLPVGGKTGTSRRFNPETGQYEDGRYRSTFVALAPAEEPRLVLAIVVDDPQGEYYAGVVAAPIARDVLERLREMLAADLASR